MKKRRWAIIAFAVIFAAAYVAMGYCIPAFRIKLEADYLAKLAFDGAKKLYGDPLSDEVKERLVFELYIMKTMGFPGYFLIVQDFINAARTQLGVSVGPGRGSAAGSAVAYCLGITKIDPIQYDLLFERFLNPDRISLPDIDVEVRAREGGAHHYIWHDGDQDGHQGRGARAETAFERIGPSVQARAG